jgi:signal transduction histidine kinase
MLQDVESIEVEETLYYIKETLESTDDGLMVTDMDNKIKVYNQRFLELLEIPQKVINSKDFRKVYKLMLKHISDSKTFRDVTSELKGNPEAECFDIVETKKSLILEYYSKPQRIGEEIVGRVWSFRDITSKKWAENALKVAYISFNNILESSVDGIIVIDDDGRICYFNHAAESMFQEKVDEMFSDIIVFPITGDKIKEIEIERIEGGKGTAEMRIVETEWEGKHAFLAMLRDITDRKQALEQLDRHRKNLEDEVKQRTHELLQAEKMVALGQLVSGVAHEVNNPLAFIKSNTEFISDVLNELKEQFIGVDIGAETFEEIEGLIKINIDGINRISAITNALKRFARPGSQDKSFNSVNQGIQDTLLLMGNKFKHRIEVKEDYGDIPLTLCNIEQLNQVFMNVFLNASEAMAKGTVTIKTWCDDENVYINIADDGMGIPEEKIKQIFDPFFTTKDSGTGLGLSLSYRIIQAHGGNIKVESRVSVGTIIKIEFPLVKEND